MNDITTNFFHGENNIGEITISFDVHSEFFVKPSPIPGKRSSLAEVHKGSSFTLNQPVGCYVNGFKAIEDHGFFDLEPI